MKVDYVFILGAGLGTRMGKVGKSLPKLLWPVFEKSLLELQYEFAKNFNPKEVFINTYYEAQKIHSLINDKDIPITVLHEEELLDIGGGIHNLARKLDYKGNVLILNGDQFLFFDEVAAEEMIDSSSENVATLLAIEVPKGSNYNELVLEEGKLKTIAKPKSNSEYITYSGVSIINLEKLTPKTGESKFFDSVANYKTEDVAVIISDELEYNDFGTAERYLESMRNVLSGDRLEMRHFLFATEGIRRSKINDNYCYNCSGDKFSINLTEEEIVGNGSIILKTPQVVYEKDSIVFGDLIS